MSVSADTAGERQFLPEAHKLANWLLLVDAGYIDRAWFEQVNDAGGFYLVRGTQSLNPKIIQAWRGDGREVVKTGGTVTERGWTGTLSGRGTGYGGEIRQGRISVGPALVCRGKAALPVDDQPTASGMISRAGDEPVSLPLAGGVVI